MSDIFKSMTQRCGKRKRFLMDLVGVVSNCFGEYHLFWIVFKVFFLVNQPSSMFAIEIFKNTISSTY